MVSEPPPAEPRSLSESVHVWPLDLTASAASMETLGSFLDQSEHARAARIQAHEGRRRFVLGHGALRLVAGRYLNRRPGEIVFASNVRGKPAIVHADLCFTYSTSGNMAVMAFTVGADIGIDIEEVRPVEQPLDIASKYFHALEVRELAGTTADQRDIAFLRLWTGKEAVVKAAGLGLTMPLDGFCLTGFSSRNARMTHRPDLDDEAEWEVCDLSMPQQFVAALAYRRPPRRIVQERPRTLDELLIEP